MHHCHLDVASCHMHHSHGHLLLPYYTTHPGHTNRFFDPASEFLSTHRWIQNPACQRCFYKPLKNCHPASGFRARGKRRGFSPGAAARHSQYARVYAEFVQNTLFFIFSFSLGWGGWTRKKKLGSAGWTHQKYGKNWAKIRWAKKFGFSRLNPNFEKKLGPAGWTQFWKKIQPPYNLVVRDLMNQSENHIENHSDFPQRKSENLIETVKIFVERIKIPTEEIIHH